MQQLPRAGRAQGLTCRAFPVQAEMKGDVTTQRRWEAYDKLGTFVIYVMSFVLGIQALGLEGKQQARSLAPARRRTYGSSAQARQRAHRQQLWPSPGHLWVHTDTARGEFVRVCFPVLPCSHVCPCYRWYWWFGYRSGG